MILPENQPYFTFNHLGTDYYIWVLIGGGGANDLDRVYLSTEAGNGRPVSQVNSSIYKLDIPKGGGEPEIKAFMNDVFLPKVNAFLLEKGEAPDTGTFPVNGQEFEKVNWVIENSLQFIHGQVVIAP